MPVTQQVHSLQSMIPAYQKTNNNSFTSLPPRLLGGGGESVGSQSIQTQQQSGTYDTRAAAIAASIPSDMNAIRILGYTTVGDGGETLYKRVSSAPAHSGKFQSADGTWWEIAETPINILQFGASPNIANNATAIQASFNYASQANSRQVNLRSGTFPYTGALTSSARLMLQGEGAGTTIFSPSGSVAGAAYEITRASGDLQPTGHRYLDFEIAPPTPSSRESGIHVTLASGGYMSNFVFDGVKVGETNGWGLYLDNSIANPDGFFVGTIRRCVFYNGVYGQNTGDSFNFEENQVTAGNSGQNPGIYFSGVSGARQYIIRENNITCRGGALVLNACDQARIENNQFEHGVFYGNGAYTGVFDAHIYVNNCLQPKIIGNTVNPFVNYTMTVGTPSAFFHNGTNTLTAVSSTVGLLPGDVLSNGSGLLPVGLTIVSTTSNTIVMSGLAAGTAIDTLTVKRTVNTAGPNFAISIDGTTNEALIEDNDIAPGLLYHIGIGSSSKNTRIGSNRYYGNLTPAIYDIGQGTMGVSKTPTLLNSWVIVNALTPVSYKKGLDGRVNLAGIVKSGTIATNLFVLPVGFRPSENLIFPVYTNTGSGVLSIDTSGNVLAAAGGTAEFSLNGVNFAAPLIA